MITKVLERLWQEKKISVGHYNKYRSQVLNGDDIGCIEGLKRKYLISD